MTSLELGGISQDYNQVSMQDPTSFGVHPSRPVGAVHSCLSRDRTSFEMHLNHSFGTSFQRFREVGGVPRRASNYNNYKFSNIALGTLIFQGKGY